MLFFAAFLRGTESKMKLWDVLATCLLLLSSVATRPLYQNPQPAKKTYFPRGYTDSGSLSVEEVEPQFQREDRSLQEISMEDQCKAHNMFWHSVLWCTVTVIGSHLNGAWLAHMRVVLQAKFCLIQCIKTSVRTCQFVQTSIKQNANWNCNLNQWGINTMGGG